MAARCETQTITAVDDDLHREIFIKLGLLGVKYGGGRRIVWPHGGQMTLWMFIPNERSFYFTEFHTFIPAAWEEVMEKRGVDTEHHYLSIGATHTEVCVMEYLFNPNACPTGVENIKRRSVGSMELFVSLGKKARKALQRGRA